MTMTENPYQPTYEPPAWWSDDRKARLGTFWISKRLVPGDVSTIRFLSESGEFDASRAKDGAVFSWAEVPEALETFGGMAVPR